MSFIDGLLPFDEPIKHTGAGLFQDKASALVNTENRGGLSGRYNK